MNTAMIFSLVGLVIAFRGLIYLFRAFKLSKFKADTEEGQKLREKWKTKDKQGKTVEPSIGGHIVGGMLYVIFGGGFICGGIIRDGATMSMIITFVMTAMGSLIVLYMLSGSYSQYKKIKKNEDRLTVEETKNAYRNVKVSTFFIIAFAIAFLLPLVLDCIRTIGERF